ncbi:MAG: hypothetical protein C4563_00550 [Desulfobulbus sp.]|nr:MAG: hypothetical protein C4563_00550 [Desulfobulbus sp.]
MKRMMRHERQTVARALTVVFIMTQLVLTAACSYHRTDVDMFVSVSTENRGRGTEISAHELHKILTGYFGNVFIKLSDAKYALADNDKVAAMSRFHVRPDWDCDDYAIAAMVPMRNYAFGVMYITTARGERHVANVFVNENREVVFWEAQKNEFYRGKFHKPELIVF